MTYGPILPPLEDASMHTRIKPDKYRYEILPTALGVERNDAMILMDQALRIGDLCGPQHPAMITLVAHMRANYADSAWVDEWLSQRQVWACLPWSSEAMRAFAARGGAAKPKPCGTMAAVRRHERRKEQLCEACVAKRAEVNATNYRRSR